MKKFIIVTMCVMIVSLVAGLVILGRTGVLRISPRQLEIRESEVSEITDIEKIEVDSVSKVNIIRTDDSQLKADLKLDKQNEDVTLAVSEDKNTKSVKVKVERKSKLSFLMTDWSSELDVYIPRTYQADLSVKTISGEIENADISGFRNVALESTSGRIEASGKSENQETLKLKTVSGRISANNISGYQTVEADSTSGRIELSNLAGAVDASTVSGRITLAFDELKNNMKANSTSGRVTIDLPDSANYALNFETVSGDLDNGQSLHLSRQTRTYYEGVTGDGTYKVEVKTVSGSLQID